MGLMIYKMGFKSPSNQRWQSDQKKNDRSIKKVKRRSILKKIGKGKKIRLHGVVYKKTSFLEMIEKKLIILKLIGKTNHAWK